MHNASKSRPRNDFNTDNSFFTSELCPLVDLTYCQITNVKFECATLNDNGTMNNRHGLFTIYTQPGNLNPPNCYNRRDSFHINVVFFMLSLYFGKQFVLK